ncbi:hypothetical protein TARUN_6865 [Trichoderma arundinaceum]|uniref:Fe2OG dioxygenase domain-containing protein n=1 Tax=Trichoderma arundinaceum TaxID=490622 RepID=A0A395NHG6_TRIAR|nr:hypothetical protein TARUN_6865 [Trichoderma arundinaceum]
MAAAGVARPQPTSGGPLDEKIDLASQNASVAFDPLQHLCYKRPSSTISLDDLGLDFPQASSQTAITEPFPLLTPAGVRELRADIFRPEIVGKYGSWKYPGVYRIRGYGPAAPFTYSMWRSPEMQKACSDAAGVDLDIIMDYEIGQLNVQLPKHVDRSGAITDNLPPPEPPKASNDDAEPDEEGADLKDLVSAWHHDSYPWVCVLMLSDPVGMSGGETALRKGDGGILKMRQPGMGYAVMMQGSMVSHAALRTLGSGERITFVVSMRPSDPLLQDTSTLRTVKPISNNDELFRQWTGYRFDVVAKRLAKMRETLQAEGRPAAETHRLTKEWVQEQIAYLQTTVDEMDLNDYVAPNFK